MTHHALVVHIFHIKFSRAELLLVVSQQVDGLLIVVCSGVIVTDRALAVVGEALSHMT